MGIFSKLKRAVGKGKAIGADLGRLDKLKRGTAQQAINFVLEGTDETVLATISNLATGNELEVGKLWISREEKTLGRRAMLARQDPFDVELSRRYSEVLLASCKDLPDSTAGSDKVPPLIRVFFSEALEGIKETSNMWPSKVNGSAVRCLTLDNMLRVAEELGGNTEDVVDILYNARSQWGCIDGQLYRSEVSTQPLFKHHVDACTVAARRLTAAARAEILRDIHKYGLIGEPAYQEFLLDMAGDSAKVAREAGLGGILATARTPELEAKAAERLENGNVNMRAGMVEFLATVGSEETLGVLREHKEKREDRPNRRRDRDGACRGLAFRYGRDGTG